MDKEKIQEARRNLLKQEIENLGLSVVARRAQKPVRQINDMAAGRKTIGPNICMEIGPRIRPDRNQDWLLRPFENSNALFCNEKPPVTYGNIQPKKTRREEQIEKITKLLAKTDLEGLAVMLHEAERMAERYPLAKQTPRSPQ